MDNQQATSRITGLYLGEGHFSLAKNLRNSGKWNIRTEVGFTNQDPALVDLVCEFLEENHIGHHIRMSSADCYQVVVVRHEEIKKFIDILHPYLHGRKLAEANLLYRFVSKAIAKAARPVPSIPGSGKLAGLQRWRNQLVYDDLDLKIVSEKEKLRESSETIRIPQCWVNHGPHREDIVQS